MTWDVRDPLAASTAVTGLSIGRTPGFLLSGVGTIPPPLSPRVPSYTPCVHPPLLRCLGTVSVCICKVPPPRATTWGGGLGNHPGGSGRAKGRRLNTRFRFPSELSRYFCFRGRGSLPNIIPHRPACPTLPMAPHFVNPIVAFFLCQDTMGVVGGW